MAGMAMAAHPRDSNDVLCILSLTNDPVLVVQFQAGFPWWTYTFQDMSGLMAGAGNERPLYTGRMTLYTCAIFLAGRMDVINKRWRGGFSEAWAWRGAAALTVGLASGAGMCAEAAVARPNILLMIADDFGVDSHPFYNANTNARFPPTPNINRLYSNGVMFRSCFSYPTSSPTRSCMLTGRYGFRTGVGYALANTNEPTLTRYELTIPELMAQSGAGYDCAMFGKWHCDLTPEGPNEIGGFPLFVGGLHGEPIPTYSLWRMYSNGMESICTEYSTEFIVSNATRWIASRPPGTNWFCWVGFHSVHTPLHLPPTNLCPTYAHLDPHQLVKDRDYWEAMAESLDWGVGQLLESVDLTNTVVFFVGDNGTIGGVEYGNITNRIIQEPYPEKRSKATLYQGGVSVPMFVAGAGVSNATRICSNLVSVVDFFATILELAGVDYAPYFSEARPLDSRSFVELLRNPTAPPHREFVLSENFNNSDDPLLKGDKGRAIFDQRYKYIAFDSIPHAFYDLWLDPYEGTNLYGGALSPEQSNSLSNLQAQLSQLQNFPCLTAAQGAQGELAAAFINTVNFSLWEAPHLMDSPWTIFTNAVAVTNETEVRFSSLPQPTNTIYFRLTAPAR